MYKKIVMSRFGGLGDMVMLLPILRGIKTLSPNSELIVVGEKNAASLMEKCPFIDKYIGYDKSTKASWQIIKTLWRADVVYMMDTLYRISLIYFLARIKKRVGLPHKRKKFLTDVLSPKKWMDYAFEPVVYAAFTKEAIGIDVTQLEGWDTFYYPEATDIDKKNIDKILESNQVENYIVCSLETGGHAKNWPIEYWLDLFNKLDTLGKQVVIIGTKTDNYNNIELPSNVFDARGKTTLIETGYLIKKADLVINGCSFPIHVANAVNTPVIGLYGSQPDWRGRPQKIFSSILSMKECAPCDYLYKGPGWCENPTCMQSITADQVFLEVKHFYELNKPLGEYLLIKGEQDVKQITRKI